ncbi:MAG: hypothetical protein NMNS01_29270 [Nitrosomonas sp.]|nr:MAG: hypothetical protein NMNS01_29270 [Nitrosomonas sp.]
MPSIISINPDEPIFGRFITSNATLISPTIKKFVQKLQLVIATDNNIDSHYYQIKNKINTGLTDVSGDKSTMVS